MTDESYDVCGPPKEQRLFVSFTDLIINDGKCNTPTDVTEYILSNDGLTYCDLKIKQLGTTEGVPQREDLRVIPPVVLFEYNCLGELSFCDYCKVNKADMVMLHYQRIVTCFSCTTPVELNLETMSMKVRKHSTKSYVVKNYLVWRRLLQVFQVYANTRHPRDFNRLLKMCLENNLLS